MLSRRALHRHGAIPDVMLVLIVDDHPLLRQAIRQVIEHHFPTAIVREASTGEEAAGVVRREPVE
ncbi:MAG: hypothetical protein Q8L77_03585 [Nitrospirota bacterium]|nr:hypothetical protein [Nitrospirota bacterium]